MPKSPFDGGAIAAHFEAERRRWPFKAWRHRYGGAIWRPPARATFSNEDDKNTFMAVLANAGLAWLVEQQTFKKRQPRDPRIEPLITEGVALVRSGKSRRAAARLIAKREYVKGFANSEDALFDQLRRDISQALKS